MIAHCELPIALDNIRCPWKNWLDNNLISLKCYHILESFRRKAEDKFLRDIRGPKKYEPINEVIMRKCWVLFECAYTEKLHPTFEVYIEELKKNNRFSMITLFL